MQRKILQKPRTDGKSNCLTAPNRLIEATVYSKWGVGAPYTSDLYKPRDSTLTQPFWWKIFWLKVLYHRKLFLVSIPRTNPPHLPTPCHHRVTGTTTHQVLITTTMHLSGHLTAMTEGSNLGGCGDGGQGPWAEEGRRVTYLVLQVLPAGCLAPKAMCRPLMSHQRSL